jgi:predicted DNA-binding transcriptional regulator AlpA
VVFETTHRMVSEMSYNSLSPRDLSLPRYALRRDEAAASVAISPTLFDEWIRQGKMPKGRKIGGVVLWDAQEVYEFWCNLRDADEPAVNPFDGFVA